MKRDRIEDLKQWKESKSRKPLVLKGARQTGKTWLMKEFGKNEYKNTVYLNFESKKYLGDIFKSDFDIDRLIVALQAESGIVIDPSTTLIIFDEIQCAPEALTSLKYFNENAPQFHIVAAGSLLGMAFHNNVSFPVGKVDFLNLHPMSFKEFLCAVKEQKLLDILSSEDWKLIATYKDKFIERLKHYYFVGGMPEVVKTFRENQDFHEARKIQKQILNDYEQDFSKHAPASIVPRIRMVWNTILSQLAKENRKFIYGQIKSSARAKDFESAINWLVDCGLVYKVARVKKPNYPLKSYEDLNSFKLYLLDIGLLNAMGDIDPKIILQKNKLFTEFKGSVTEQYAVQQIKTRDIYPAYYWSAERSNAEVDMLLQFRDQLVGIEVKAEENLQSKSLRFMYEKYRPDHAIRLSMSDYREQEWMTNIPLYAVNNLKTWLINKK